MHTNLVHCYLVPPRIYKNPSHQKAALIINQYQAALHFQFRSSLTRYTY